MTRRDGEAAQGGGRRAIAVPHISRSTLLFFRSIVRRYFRRQFHAVRANGITSANLRVSGPLIVYTNHTSWWDPMICYQLAATLAPERRHYAPMDAEALDRYSILKRIGCFPVDIRSARGAVQFLRMGEAVVQSGGVLWVTPQGRFADVRERPLELKPGMATLAARLGECTLVPVAMEYPFWDERKPEALVEVGEPIAVRGEPAEQLEPRLTAALEAAMDRLRDAALTRNPQAFERVLLRGTVGAGGFYALGKRLRGRFHRPAIPCRAHHTHGVRRREHRPPQRPAVVLFALALASLACAAAPAGLFLSNLRSYREPPAPANPGALPAVSVLIPARDEELAITAALDHVLRSRGVAFEVVVMDDASTDRTAELIAALAAQESRVRLEQAPPLPRGWNGKQHACWALAHAARHPVLCFVDADVRLEPDALARMATFLEQSNSALVSGFPRQITATTLEWLLLPLIHFVLLGFLPIPRMRASTKPSFAAGCGQFLMVRREPLPPRRWPRGHPRNHA